MAETSASPISSAWTRYSNKTWTWNVSAKKKELIGNFKNPGAKWDRQPQLVKDHAFRSEAKALATPRGIYDLQANRGSVVHGHQP